MFVQKVFFRGVQVPPKRVWIDRAKQLGELEDVCLQRNRAQLRGILLSPSSAACIDDSLSGSVVIFSHPISRKAKYFFTETSRAKFYLERGCRVFIFDYNGFGESDSIDLYYWRDVVAAIQYVRQSLPQKKVILHGTSFGAFHIVRALEHLPLDSKVILENVNKSLLSYWRRWPLTRFSVMALELLRVRAVQEMDVQSVFKALRREDLDIRFIACENDEMTTLEEMQELYSLLPLQRKKFYVFDNAGHLSAPAKNPGLYVSALFGDS